MCTTSRTLADCDALRAHLDPAGSVVVIGAGWIGAEFAASARQRGAEVTVIEPGSVPLERVLGADVGAIYRDVHLEHGVRLLAGTGVERFEGDGAAVQQVRISDGTAIECDFVVVGIGVTPRTALAEAAGLNDRQRNPGRPGTRDRRPQRVCRRRRRQRVAPVLRATHPRRALGQRA